MTERRHFCDACGILIRSDRTALDVRCGPLRRRAERIDMCPECVGKFQAMLDVTRTPAEGATAATPPAEVRMIARRADVET